MAEKCNKADSGHHAAHHHHKHKTWNPIEYEKVISDMDYQGPKLVVNHFVELNIPKDSRIIDMAAGTGLVGCSLRDNGYTNIDALDASSEMLTMAKERDCYKNIITWSVERDTSIPIQNNTYDHVIMSGCLCHIDYEALPQIINICKPGGTISWSIGLSEDIMKVQPGFADSKFENYIESLCEQNVLKFHSGYPKRVKNYALGKDGWVYIMEIL